MKKIIKLGILALFLSAIVAGSFAFIAPESGNVNRGIVKFDPIYSWFNNPSHSGSPVSTNTITSELARLNGLMDGHTYSTTSSPNNAAFEWGIDEAQDEAVIFRSK